MSKSFSAQVEAFKDKARNRSLAVFRESAQRLAHQSNVPTAQGGKMPVDTGFMRASQAASLQGVPSGPSKGAPDMTYVGPIGDPVELVVLQAQLGGSVWIGWTAMYAPFMEEKYGFFRSGAQGWTFIVNDVVAEVKRRFP